jgi:hypothetical protein
MKPLKRFARFLLPLITGLKPGVNEMSISRTFEAKHCQGAVRLRIDLKQPLTNIFIAQLLTAFPNSVI